MKKLDPREFGLNDNASSPAESARVNGRFYAGIFSGTKSKRILVRIFAILIVVFFAFLLFFSFFRLLPSNKNEPRLIYEVYDYSGNVPEFHSIALDGSDDKVIYTAAQHDAVVVVDHQDIEIEDQNGASASFRFIDAAGKSVDGKYRGFDGFGMDGALPQIYSADGTMVAGIPYSTSSQPFSVEILNFKTSTLKTYSCGSGCGISGLPSSTGAFSAEIETFSPDGTKLFFSAGDEVGPTKYFYLSLVDGSFHDVPTNSPIIPSRYEYYYFFPVYDAMFKKSLDTNSLDMINFENGTTTHLIDNSVDQFIFNGKDVIYTTLSSSTPDDDDIVAKGINVQSGEHYPVLPVNLVNTYKHNAITLLDFLPQSSTFLYEIEGDSGWEVRTHNLDSGTDMSVINLTSGQRPDGSQFLEEYVGIVF
jgi:hypothetical protein